MVELNCVALYRLAQLVEDLCGEVYGVRFMREKEDVSYSSGADEVEISVLHGDDNLAYFSLDEGADDWVETV